MSSTFSRIPKNFASENDMNNAIEQFVKDLPVGYAFTEDEKKFAMQYSGKGQAFEKNEDLTSEAGLYEFYTPDYVGELMWELARHHGFKGGNVLEPSCATGHLFQYAKEKCNFTGIEINPITAKIAQHAFPQSEIYTMGFEQAFLNPPRYNSLIKKPWIKGYPFDLVIGNPPYGEFTGLYKSLFNFNYHQIEFFFLLKGLELLKSGGVLVYLTSSNYLRNGIGYEKVKQKVSEIATLQVAFRTPRIFKRTGIPTDILVFTKK